jgi:NAD(P)-dependent dehydrogenase (short-subunit alcohol dehydrogenase family)
MSPSATSDIVNEKVVSDISLPAEVPESNQTAANVPGDQLFSLKNQTILITGAGRGLGIELALGVVENGGHVAALDILETPSDEWAHLQKTAKQRGVTVSYRKADITDEEDFKSAVVEISSRGRELNAPLQGAIACAGIQQKIPTLDYPVADFERMLRVNTVGMLDLERNCDDEMGADQQFRIFYHCQSRSKRYGGKQGAREHRAHRIDVRQYSQQSTPRNFNSHSYMRDSILTSALGSNMQRLQHKQSRRPPAMQINGPRNRCPWHSHQHIVTWRKPHHSSRFS